MAPTVQVQKQAMWWTSSAFAPSPALLFLTPGLRRSPRSAFQNLKATISLSELLVVGFLATQRPPAGIALKPLPDD